MAAKADTVARDSAKWKRNRSRALRRDQYRCQYCDRHDSPHADLHVHHIHTVEHGGGHGLDNLITLCSPCHNKLHARADEGQRRVTLDLLRQDWPSFGFPDTRTPLSSLRGIDQQIVAELKADGPVKVADMAGRVDYSRQYVQRRMKRLQEAKYVARVSRGVYGYITTLEYRRSLEVEVDEYGRRTVRVWDPGQQAELEDFTNDPREASDE